jgi:hypothetical protein
MMRLRPETDPLPRLIAFPFLAACGVLAGAFFWQGRLLEQAAACPLRSLLGLPCPTCGGTHAALALVRGDLAGAWRQNPLVTAAAVALLLWGAISAVTTLVPRWRFRLDLAAGEKRALRLAALFAVLMGWAYEIVRLG